MKNYVTALGIAYTIALPVPQLTRRVSHRHLCPPTFRWDAVSNEVFLVGRGVGTQNYVCQPSEVHIGRVALALFTPQATLFSDLDENSSPTSSAPTLTRADIVRATWQDSRDTSAIWAV